MYIPPQFLEERPQALQSFIARHPLGALVAMTEAGLSANHVPMLWKHRPGSAGVLQGHVAKANPIWQALAADAAVLVIFSGADHYISPSWYPAKREHGKVVPTWNYSVVHAHGTIRFLQDDVAAARLHVTAATDHHEKTRPEPWKVSDAPADYIDSMLKQIVVFEIVVQRLVGKFKANQHREARERQSVLAALETQGVSMPERREVIREPND